MSLKIHKYELNGFEEIKFIPEDAVILSLAMQKDTIVFWALVDDSKPLVERKFLTKGTGWEIAPGAVRTLKFVGTVQTPAGFVWHVFEIVR